MTRRVRITQACRAGVALGARLLRLGGFDTGLDGLALRS